MGQLCDAISKGVDVAIAVGVVFVFAATYWVLPSPESRL